MLDLIRAREAKGEIIMPKEDFEKIIAEVGPVEGSQGRYPHPVTFKESKPTYNLG